MKFYEAQKMKCTKKSASSSGRSFLPLNFAIFCIELSAECGPFPEARAHRALSGTRNGTTGRIKAGQAMRSRKFRQCPAT